MKRCAGLLLAALAGSAPAEPCRLPGIAIEIQCGHVSRALDPAQPQGRRIDIHYALVPALSRRKLPDPVFLLAGGPGQSAITLAPRVLPLLARLNNRRDIVFVDQRGTGRSAPLVCDEPPGSHVFEAADPQQQVQRMLDCKARLAALSHVGREANLRFFTTVLAAQDLDAVRLSLGAAQVNLVGVSYGTRLALDYARQFPQAVRRSVLDGVAPPDMALPASSSADAQAALDALFSACAADAECRRNHPELRARWSTLLASLPRTIQVVDSLTGRPYAVTLTRELLLAVVRAPLYAPWLAAALPAALDDAAHGRFDGLAGLAAAVAPRRGGDLAAGMHFSVVCAEDMPRVERAREPPGIDFGDAPMRAYREVCAQWPRGEVPPVFYEVGAARSPVLLLSGGADPATPPRHAQRVAAALGALARHVVAPHAGHGVLAVGCGADILFRFIDAAEADEALAVDAGCSTRMPRPPVFEPAAVAAEGPP